MKSVIALLSSAVAVHGCVTAHVYFSSCVYDIADGINHMVVQYVASSHLSN